MKHKKIESVCGRGKQTTQDKKNSAPKEESIGQEKKNPQTSLAW